MHLQNFTLNQEGLEGTQQHRELRTAFRIIQLGIHTSTHAPEATAAETSDHGEPVGGATDCGVDRNSRQTQVGHCCVGVGNHHPCCRRHVFFLLIRFFFVVLFFFFFFLLVLKLKKGNTFFLVILFDHRRYGYFIRSHFI